MFGEVPQDAADIIPVLLFQTAVYGLIDGFQTNLRAQGFNIPFQFIQARLRGRWIDPVQEKGHDRAQALFGIAVWLLPDTSFTLILAQAGRRRNLAGFFFYVGILVFLKLCHLDVAPVLHLIADDESVFIQGFQHIVHIGNSHIVISEDVFLQPKRPVLKAACSVRLPP